MSSRSSRMLYVGNLPADYRERDVEDIFYKYGPIVKIDMKYPPRPPGYCFIEYEDAHDAEDAIRGRDGYEVDGHHLRVELSHGGRGSASTDRYNSFSSGGRRDGGLPRNSDYRVIITGLPTSASWQDLKDHMRRAGDVSFAQVFRDGKGTTGVVDYTNYDDMKYAIRKLDDSEFKNPFSRSYIRVKEYASKRSVSRSRSRSFSRSHSHSHSRSRSPSRSPSVSRRKINRSVKSRSRSGSIPRSRLRSGSIPSSRSRSVSRSKSRSRSRSRTPRRKAQSGNHRNRSLSRSRSPSHSHSQTPKAE